MFKKLLGLNTVAVFLQIKEYVLSSICKVRVDSLERLVQIAAILGKATEDAGNVFHNTTVRRVYFVVHS